MADYTGKVTAYNGHPLYEGRPAGDASDPIGTVGDLVFNAGYDFMDMFSGLKTMGNAATARFYEGVPTPQNDWTMKPWIRPQEDWNTAQQMGKAIVDNYAHSYVDPVLQGRPLDIASHFIAHPLNSILDLNGVAQLTGAPRLLKNAFTPKTVTQAAQQVAEQAAPEALATEANTALQDVFARQKLAQEAAVSASAKQATAEAENAAKEVALAKAQLAANKSAETEAALQRALAKQEAANKAVQDAMTVSTQATEQVDSSGTVLGAMLKKIENLKNKIIQQDKAKQLAGGIVEDLSKGILAEDINFHDDLGKAWNQIPKKLRDEVQSYAEGWHPKLLAGGKMPPAVADYLKKAEEYSAIMRDRISGFVDNVDLELDKFQPATVKLNGLSTEQWKSMTRPEQLEALRLTRNYLNKLGINPQYSPHVLPSEVQSTLRNPLTLHGSVKKTLQAPEDASFVKTKQSAGEKASKSHYDSMRTRWIQISQFQQIYKQILEKAIDNAQQLDLLKNAPDAGSQQIAREVSKELLSQKGLAEVAAENAAQDLAKAQAYAKEMADKLAQAEKALQSADNAAVRAEKSALKAQGGAEEAEKIALEAEARAAKAQREAAKARRDAAKKAADAAKAEAELTAKFKEQAEKALADSLKTDMGVQDRLKAAGYEAISGQKLVESVLGPLQGSVLSEQELANLARRLMPGDIYLPKEFIQAIDHAMKARTYSSNPFIRAYDKANTFAKRYQLGGNPTYGLAQTAQAMFMLELVAMNGPRSAITSLISYGLALNPKIRATVPLSIAEDVLASTVSTQRYLENAVEALFNQPILNQTPEAMQSFIRKPVKAFENFVDFNLKAGAFGDAFVRAKAGIAHALMIAQENTPLGQAVRDMFDTTKMIATLDSTFASAEQKMAVAQHVNKALGNFRDISEKAGMKTLGRLTPYPAWMAFITEYTIGLPVNHPYKTIIGNNLAQLQEEYVADPNVPSYLKGAVGIEALGPNGLPQVVRKEGMNPLTSVPQLLEVAQSVITHQGDANMVQLSTAPIQLTFMIATGLNPMTLNEFEDSSLYKVGDKQYTEQDILSGNVASGIAKPVKPVPDPVALSLRSFFSVQERWLETIAEKAWSNGQRSQMSTPWHSAPKLDRRTGAARQSNDWITMLINMLVNEQPIEYDPNAKFLEQKQQQEAQQQAMKQLMRRQMLPPQ